MSIAIQKKAGRFLRHSVVTTGSAAAGILLWVSKKIYPQLLKATVAKCWCLEQLNTFSVCGGKCSGQIKSTDMCRKTVPKAWSGSSECSISKTPADTSDSALEMVWWSKLTAPGGKRSSSWRVFLVESLTERNSPKWRRNDMTFAGGHFGPFRSDTDNYGKYGTVCRVTSYSCLVVVIKLCFSDNDEWWREFFGLEDVLATSGGHTAMAIRPRWLSTSSRCFSISVLL